MSPEPEPIRKPTRFEESLALISLLTAALALFFFGWIADSVAHQRTDHLDQSVRNAVHRYASPQLNTAMTAVSFLGGDGLIGAAVVATLLFLRSRRRRAALWLIVTLAGTLVLDVALKLAFHRPRPAPFFGPVPQTYSFPSGHALFSFCFYGVLAGLLAGRIRSLYVRIVIWMMAAVLVFAIGLSRIYLGVHYLSDVIAGYLTAALWVATMVYLDRWRKGRDMIRLNLSVAFLVIVSAFSGNPLQAQTTPTEPAGTVRVDANRKHVLNSFDPDHAFDTSYSQWRE